MLRCPGSRPCLMPRDPPPPDSAGDALQPTWHFLHQAAMMVPWMLLTTEGDVTATDALEIVSFHERRWLIEGQRSLTQ